jgi:hypothetical protein
MLQSTGTRQGLMNPKGEFNEHKQLKSRLTRIAHPVRQNRSAANINLLHGAEGMHRIRQVTACQA